MATDWTNGASFQGGALNVTNTSQVSNLNASMLQGKVPADFLQIKSGITQDINGNISFSSNKMITLDTTSKIRIGNLVIQSSDSGNGILIGTV